MRIAWFAPKNGNSTSTYFSNLILPYLEKKFDVIQYSNQVGDNSIFLRAFVDDKKNKFDHICYFLEDHTDLQNYRIQMPVTPGIVFAFSYIMSDRGAESIKNSGWIQQIDNFKNNKPEFYDPLVLHKQMLPQAIRELSFATDVVFFNPYDGHSYLNFSNPTLKDKNIYNLEIPVKKYNFNKNKSKILAYAGFPQIPSRMHIILEALKQLEDYKLLWMLNSNDLNTAKEFCHEFEVDNVEFIIGRSVENWLEILNKSSIILHPLFSHQENLFPYLQISISSEKPVIVSDFGYYKSLPDNIVFKLPLGIGEVERLIELIRIISETDYNNNYQKEYSENFIAEKISNDIEYIIKQSVEKNKNLLNNYRTFIDKHKTLLINEQLNKAPYLNETFKELGWE